MIEAGLCHDLFLRAQVVSVAGSHDSVMRFAHVAGLRLRITALTLLARQGESLVFPNSCLVGLCCYIHLSYSN